MPQPCVAFCLLASLAYAARTSLSHSRSHLIEESGASYRWFPAPYTIGFPRIHPISEMQAIHIFRRNPHTFAKYRMKSSEESVEAGTSISEGYLLGLSRPQQQDRNYFINDDLDYAVPFGETANHRMQSIEESTQVGTSISERYMLGLQRPRQQGRNKFSNDEADDAVPFGEAANHRMQSIEESAEVGTAISERYLLDLQRPRQQNRNKFINGKADDALPVEEKLKIATNDSASKTIAAKVEHEFGTAEARVRELEAELADCRAAFLASAHEAESARAQLRELQAQVVEPKAIDTRLKTDVAEFKAPMDEDQPGYGGTSEEEALKVALEDCKKAIAKQTAQIQSYPFRVSTRAWFRGGNLITNLKRRAEYSYITDTKILETMIGRIEEKLDRYTLKMKETIVRRKP